ncbi:MAG: ribonuclease J, partial [Clostridia bacterium]|nr:ribonuclease J [Clostridia bacterium]
QEELKMMINLVRPKFFVPVHGEYRHLVKHAKLAETMGIPGENVFVAENGQVLEFTKDKGTVGGRVTAGRILIDGLGVGDVGNIVLRDRQHLAENGIMIVVLALEKGSNQLMAGPEIISRGFVYVRESDELMDEAQQVVYGAVEKCLDKGISDWGRIKNCIRDELADFIWKRTKRSPMIMPIIMEI